MFEITPTHITFAFEAVILFLCGELSLLFLFRAFKAKRDKRVDLGWGIVFTNFAIMQMFNIISMFYLTRETFDQFRQTFEALGMVPIVTTIGMLEFFYQRYHHTKYIISLTGMVIGVLYSFLPLVIAGLIFDFYFILLIIFVLDFFGKLILRSTGMVKRYIIIFTVAFCALNLGNFLANIQTVIALEEMGWESSILGFFGRILKIVGLAVMFLVLEQLPIFLEVDWKEKLVQIIIIHKTSGLPIYQGTLKGKEDVKDSHATPSYELVAGGIVGITTLLKEISESTENVKFLDHGDVKILCQYSPHLLIVLYAKENYHIYWDKLDHLQKNAEELFGGILVTWSGGNLEYFTPLNSLVQAEFR